MAQRGPKKQKQAFSFMIETELFVRLKKAALENNFTMTDIIHNTLESYVEQHEKYYDPNEPQPEELFPDEDEDQAGPRPQPAQQEEPEEEEEAEIEYPEDPPPGAVDGPGSPGQDGVRASYGK